MLKLLATCAFGLEKVVACELQRLGFSTPIVSTGRVQFEGDWQSICQTNLWLRSADRVLVLVDEFPCHDFDTLFTRTTEIAWEDWLPRDAQLPVTGRAAQSRLASVPACQRTVKKGIVQRLQQAYGLTILPETGARFKIDVTIVKDRATLTLDTTGPSLHKRGYNSTLQAKGLKETLAAALVQLSFWTPQRPFLDPFCHIGILAIEAAMYGAGIAPGLHRSFAAEAWPQFADKQWARARAEAREAPRTPIVERLIATGESAHHLALARQLADAAGVADVIHFQRKAFHEVSSKREFGCLITQLPAPRGDQQEWPYDQLYRSLPHTLRHLPTWSFFLLASYPQFEQLIQKEADRRRKLYSDRVACTYYQFHGPPPPRESRPQPVATPHDDSELSLQLPSSPARHPAPSVARPPKKSLVPVFGGLDAKAAEQAELFQSRLLKRARHLRRWPSKRGITCFRLYERDIPEIPLVVDRYEDHLHITEYERPHERDAAQHADWLELLTQAAAQALEIPASQVFLKSRHRQKGNLQHERISRQRYEIEAHEAGLRFIVNLSDYVDTGLFLDHRVTRGLVRDVADGKRFLNLFGYTGAFTVYAAAGGARQSTTVDLSPRYLSWAERNLRLNNLADPARHEFVPHDALSYLAQLPRQPRFDLAVVDPPTFSNSKRTDALWEVQRDHVRLLEELVPRMTPAGRIYFSTNFRRFKLAVEQLPAAVTVREISRQTIPEDFRNERVHRCWTIDLPP